MSLVSSRRRSTAAVALSALASAAFAFACSTDDGGASPANDAGQDAEVDAGQADSGGSLDAADAAPPRCLGVDAGGAILFCDDFDGTLDGWQTATTAGGQVGVDAQSSTSAPNALLATLPALTNAGQSSGELVRSLDISSPQLFVRANVRFESAGVPSGGAVILLSLELAADQSVSLMMTQGGLVVHETSGATSNDTTLSPAPAQSTWLEMSLSFDFASVPATLVARLGAEGVDKQLFPTRGSSPASLRVGARGISAKDAYAVRYDDLVVVH